MSKLKSKRELIVIHKLLHPDVQTPAEDESLLYRQILHSIGLLLKSRNILRPTDEDIYEYIAYVKTRKVNNVYDLPLYVLKKVVARAKFIFELFPETEKIYLCGSYVKGEYIDEHTSQEFIELKKKVRYKNKVSDFDFCTEPTVLYKSDDIDVLPRQSVNKYIEIPAEFIKTEMSKIKGIVDIYQKNM